MPLKNHFRRSVPATPKKRDSQESTRSKSLNLYAIFCSRAAARDLELSSSELKAVGLCTKNTSQPQPELEPSPLFKPSTPIPRALSDQFIHSFIFIMTSGQKRVLSNPKTWLKKTKERAVSPDRRANLNPIRSDPKAGVAPGSPSVTSHKSNRSVDAPKTTSSAPVANNNSVKLVPGSDERSANIGIPMPAGLTYFTDKNDQIKAQASNSSINDNFTNSTMPHSDHDGLPLRSAPNGAQKSYNMGASASMYGSSLGQNGSYSNTGRLPLPNNLSSPAPISTVRALSGQFGGARSQNNLRDANANAMGSDAASTISEWSSAVGGASNSGKSGRVIEKLMAERDTLKRENALLKQEKTDWLAERSMAEEKVARQLNEAEMELHEAQGNKLLLKKRDRQVGELKDKVEKERDRADEAVEHERTWKRKLEELQDSSKQTIARLQEQLGMESNSNAMLSRQWKDEKEKINAMRTKLQKDVKAHLQAVVAHADTNNQRDQVQQESQTQIDELNRVNKEQAKVFNDFKAKIDQDLEQIKADADARVAEAERLIKEVMETSDKMKWVINVKKNVKDAE